MISYELRASFSSWSLRNLQKTVSLLFWELKTSPAKVTGFRIQLLSTEYRRYQKNTPLIALYFSRKNARNFRVFKRKFPGLVHLLIFSSLKFYFKAVKREHVLYRFSQVNGSRQICFARCIMGTCERQKIQCRIHGKCKQ